MLKFHCVKVSNLCPQRLLLVKKYMSWDHSMWIMEHTRYLMIFCLVLLWLLPSCSRFSFNSQILIIQTIYVIFTKRFTEIWFSLKPEICLDHYQMGRLGFVLYSKFFWVMHPYTFREIAINAVLAKRIWVFAAISHNKHHLDFEDNKFYPWKLRI